MNNDLHNYIERIRDEITALYDLDLSDDERAEREENGDPCDLYDYFSDALDVEYTISSRGDFLGVRVYVTLGGPNIWIDTRRGEVAGAWGTDRADIWLPSEICEEINVIFAEMYECVR